MAADLSERTLKFAILECLASTNHEHKINLLGRPYSRGEGPLERRLGVRFTNDDRFRADRAFESLKAAGHIRPTYRDLTSPEEWVEITDQGRRALKSHHLDDLDTALAALDPGLVEKRAGAWSALYAGTPDSLRQAAHSARELIDHTLRAGAPSDDVEKQPWYVPIKSHDGVGRRQRLRYIAEHHAGRGGTDTAVADRACELVLAMSKSLQSSSHAEPPSRAETEDTLRALEIALRRILLPRVG